VVLDLRELEFIDSSGLRTLLTARRSAEQAGASFSLIAGHRGLERTLEIAGVHKVFTWTPAEELA
jgi:anti-sigma B factor antagonist